MKPISRNRFGMTLIELLVVIAIIGILVAIALPAVQAARESARKATCRNHLRQIGMAAQNHEGILRHFPAGGFGYRWFGDPEQGFGRDQPGGWIYNSLPYLEQGSLRAQGEGEQPIQKRAALARVAQVPLAVFHCPSRRSAAVLPYLGRAELRNIDPLAEAAKCDYAGNGGDTPYDHPAGGPPSLDPRVVAAYPWPDTRLASGIFYLRSTVAAGDITDGLSSTYLAGEKHVSTGAHSPDARDTGDDQTLYLGDDRDIRRWTDQQPRRDSRGSAPGVFGSAHSAGCHFVMADGAVRLVAYNVDPQIHRLLGNRRDGLPIDLE